MSAGSSQPADERIEAISNALYHAEMPEDRYVVVKEALAAVAAELAELNERYATVRRAYGIEAQERGRLEAELPALREALRAWRRYDLLRRPALLDMARKSTAIALSREDAPRAAMTDIPEGGDERFSARYSDYIKFIEAGGGPLERR